jgi:hypothetical protein
MSLKTIETVLCDLSLLPLSSEYDSVEALTMRTLQGLTIIDSSVTWVKSDVINFVKILEVARPLQPTYTAELVVHNPSTVTEIEVQPYSKETMYGYVDIRKMPIGSAITVPKTANTVLDDCEVAWTEFAGVGVVVTADAAVYVVGTHSVKLAVDATATAGEILATQAVAATNMTNSTHLRMWLRSSIAITAGDLKFLLDNTAACASPVESPDIPALIANTWTHVDLPLTAPSGCNAVISYGVKQINDKGAFNLYVDQIEYIRYGNKSVLIDGLFNGVDCCLCLKNTTALDALDDLTVLVKVKKAA